MLEGFAGRQSEGYINPVEGMGYINLPRVSLRPLNQQMESAF